MLFLETIWVEYSIWPNLDPEAKADLLYRTSDMIGNTENIFNISRFCLEILGKISLKDELHPNKDLGGPISCIINSVKAKVSAIYQKSDCFSPSFVACVTFGLNPFLLFGESAAICSGKLEKAFPNQLGDIALDIPVTEKIGQKTCVLVLSLFSQCTEVQEKAILEITKGKKIKQLKRASEFFRLRGSLKEKIDNLWSSYMIKKWEKCGIVTSTPSVGMYYQLLEECTELNQFYSLLKISKYIPNKGNLHFSAEHRAIQRCLIKYREGCDPLLSDDKVASSFFEITKDWK